MGNIILFKMKTVWMLGAGFSKQGGYPVVSDFLNPDFYAQRVVHEELLGGPHSKRMELIYELEEWSNLGSNLNSMMSSFMDQKDTHRMRRLNAFIMKTLAMITEFNREVYNLQYLEAFVGLIGASNSNIISFNYDTLIEEKLCHAYLQNELNNKNKGFPAPPYNLGFDSDFCKSDSDSTDYFDYGTGWLPVTLPTEGGISVIKLHGSTNLCYCLSCFNLIYRLSETSKSSTSDHHCPHCKQATEQDLLFVPPASDTSFLAWKLLAPLWAKAEDELVGAHNLIVVGYSLPYEDKTAKNLLFQVAEKNSNLRVLVVDPFMSEAMCDRFREIFPNVMFLKESCKGLMDILVTLRTKWHASASEFLLPEIYSFLLDLVSINCSRPEGALPGTLPLGEDPLDLFSDHKKSYALNATIIRMLGLSRSAKVREKLYELAMSREIDHRTRAQIAYALAGVEDQKTVEWLSGLLLETTPIVSEESPFPGIVLPHTISNSATCGLLNIAFSEPGLDFRKAKAILSLIGSLNLLMDHERLQAISAIRIFDKLHVLLNK